MSHSELRRTDMIQEQHWLSCDRILVTDEEHHGSVMVDIMKDPNTKEQLHADALLWALWVDKPYRKQGVARQLIEAAEREAKARGCQTMALEWDDREAESWTAYWYERIGYETKEFDRHSALKVKQLN